VTWISREHCCPSPQQNREILRHRLIDEVDQARFPPLFSGCYINTAESCSAAQQSIIILSLTTCVIKHSILVRIYQSHFALLGSTPNPFTPLAFCLHEIRSCELTRQKYLVYRTSPYLFLSPLNFFFLSRFLKRAASALRQHFSCPSSGFARATRSDGINSNDLRNTYKAQSISLRFSHLSLVPNCCSIHVHRHTMLAGSRLC
jgi:hypothetical protein